MGPISGPKMSLNNYHTTPRNIPEERRSYQHLVTPGTLGKQVICQVPDTVPINSLSSGEPTKLFVLYYLILLRYVRV